jgi:hypothetical protein
LDIYFMTIRNPARLGRGRTTSENASNKSKHSTNNAADVAPSVGAISRVAAAAAAAAQVARERNAVPSRVTDDEHQVCFDVIKVNRFGRGQRRVYVFEYRNRGVAANSSKNPSLLDGRWVTN